MRFVIFKIRICLNECISRKEEIRVISYSIGRRIKIINGNKTSIRRESKEAT